MGILNLTPDSFSDGGQFIEPEVAVERAHQMIAGVSGENPEGRSFHARIGYAEIAIIPQAGYKFGRFMDLVLMQKFLT